MDETLFQKIAAEVEKEWQMGGLSSGLYYDYALEIAKRYDKICQYCGTSEHVRTVCVDCEPKM